MKDPKILQKLREITQEEKECIANGNQVDWSVYNEEDTHTVYASRLLEAGKIIDVRPHTRFAYFPPHTHDYIEMIYMYCGETTHFMNGQKVVLKEGELLLLGPNTTQEILPAGEDDIAVNFIILPEFFDRSLAMLGAEDSPLRRFIIDCLRGDHQGASHYFHYQVTDVLPIQNIVENMLWMLVNSAPNKRQINQISLGLLFLQLLNFTDRISFGEEGEDLVKLYRYIEENFKTATLNEAAELLSRNIWHLSREIRKRTGKTFTEIVQEKRLSQAVFLLKNTALPVSEVALSVGYENISYFHRIFTARFGISPRKYRVANKDTF